MLNAKVEISMVSPKHLELLTHCYTLTPEDDTFMLSYLKQMSDQLQINHVKDVVLFASSLNMLGFVW